MKVFYIYKILLIFVIISILNCSSSNIITQKLPMENVIFLTDQSVQFSIPSNWVIYFSSRKFFQFVAKYPNIIYGPLIEYRGLNNTTKNKGERELYAEGWYKAIELNFPKWEYIEKNYEEVDYKNNKIFTYQFLGTFYDGNVKIKKIGYLRFFNDRIHAIYYTTKDEYFEENYKIFKQIDKSIVYSPEIPQY